MSFACETPSNGVAAQCALALQGQLPTLATARLILRAPRVTDFDTFFAIAGSERGAHLGGLPDGKITEDGETALICHYLREGVQ